MIKEALDLPLAARCVITNNALRKKFYSGFLTLSCLAAFDYEMRHQDIKLSDEQRYTIFSFLELGKNINNFYDLSQLHVQEYMDLRRHLFSTPLNSKNYQFFYSAVRHLERTRPNPWVLGTPCLEKVEEYRSKTNLVYWAAACTAAGVTEDIKSLVSNDIDFTPTCPHWLRGMHSCLLALQVIDDQIGWKGDLRQKRPSFFTGLCPERYLRISPDSLPLHEVLGIYEEMDKNFWFYMNKSKTEIPESYALRQSIMFLKLTPTLLRLKWYKSLQASSGVELVNTRHFGE